VRFALVRTATVSVLVLDRAGKPRPGAAIALCGEGVATRLSDESGRVRFAGWKAGTYEIKADLEASPLATVSVAPGGTAEATVTLPEDEGG